MNFHAMGWIEANQKPSKHPKLKRVVKTLFTWLICAAIAVLLSINDFNF